MLSNKIHRGAPSPKLIQVFSYSHRYRRTLSNIVTALINRCISIQIGDALPPQNNLLRVAGKTGSFSLKSVASAYKKFTQMKN